jgi:hypothetical protein
MGWSPSRIVVWGLAVIGAYFFVLRIAWLLELDGDAVAYGAHAVGALIAGAAFARIPARTTGPRFEAFVAGVAGMAILAAIAFASPRTYGWIAMRASPSWLYALAIIVATGALTQLAADLARGPAHTAAIVVVATAVTTCLVLLGARVAATLHLVSSSSNTQTIIAMAVLALLAGFAVQSIVAGVRPIACGCGAAVLIAWQLIEITAKSHEAFDRTIVLLALPVLAGFIGARLATQLFPPMALKR